MKYFILSLSVICLMGCSAGKQTTSSECCKNDTVTMVDQYGNFYTFNSVTVNRNQ